MDINATLLFECFAFLSFVLLTMKYIYPPLRAILEQRRQELLIARSTIAYAHEEAERIEHEAKKKNLSMQQAMAAKEQEMIAELAALREQKLEEVKEEFQHKRKRFELDLKQREAVFQNQLDQKALDVASKILKKWFEDAKNQRRVDEWILNDDAS